MKRKINTYFVILITALVFLVTLFAFDQKEDETFMLKAEEVEELEEVISPLVQKFLYEKLERYQKTILNKCKEKAYEAAEVYIDSLVAEELKLLASDTLKFPAKPTRPELREPIILNDSTIVSPIIK
jgi:hypothetical protein